MPCPGKGLPRCARHCRHEGRVRPGLFAWRKGGHGGRPVWPWTVSESALSVRRGGGVPIPTSCITPLSARFPGGSPSLKNARGPHCRLRRDSLGSGAGAVRPSPPGRTDPSLKSHLALPSGRKFLAERLDFGGGPDVREGDARAESRKGRSFRGRDEESPRRAGGFFLANAGSGAAE